MEIFLNGKKLDYEVEKETRLGEVIQSLARWLGERGAVIVSARLDGQVVNLADDAAVRARPLATVNRLEIESQNAKVLVVETMHELGRYLDRIARLAPKMSETETTPDTMRQLVEGLGWSLNVLNKVSELLQISFKEFEFEGEKFHKHLLRLGDLRDHVEEAVRQQNRAALQAVLRDNLPPVCDLIVRALPVICEQVSIGPTAEEIREELDELSSTLPGLPEKLEAIAVKISIGDTAQGMQEFAEAVTSLERLFKVIDRCRREMPLPPQVFMHQNKSFEERSQSVSKILDELIKAFERKDRVLISDLIEYEIAPEVEALLTVVEEIRKNLKGSCH